MIREINLVPAEIQSGWRRERLKRAFTIFTVLYLLLLGAITGLQRYDMWSKRADIKKFSDEKMALILKNAEYSSLMKKIRSTKSQEKDLQDRLNIVESLTAARTPWSTVLRTISRDIPRNIWLRGLSTTNMRGAGEKSVRFTGTSLTNGSVADFILMLENSVFFKSIELTYIQERELDSSMIYDFEVSTILKKR